MLTLRTPDSYFEEFSVVKPYPWLMVSKQGTCYNRVNQVFLKAVRQSGKSPKIATTVQGRTLRTRLSFCLAGAFLPIPEGVDPEKAADKLDVGYVDGDCRNIDPSNLFWVAKPDIDFLLSSTAGEDQIFVIPSAPELAISVKGEVYSLVTKNKLSPSPTGNGYLKIDVRIDGRPNTFQHHRLVAEVHVPPKDGFTIEECLEQLVINHKNGIRDDNTPSNLEWVTSKENTEDGYLRGSMVRNQELVALDIRTKKTKFFRSIIEFTEAVRLPAHVITALWKTGALEKVIIRNYVVKLTDVTTRDSAHETILELPNVGLYHFYWKGVHALTGTAEDIGMVLPGPVSRIQEDGSISAKPKKPFRLAMWSITKA